MGKGSSRFFYLDGPSSQWEVGTLISQSSHIPKQPIPTGSQSTTFSPDLCVGFLFLVLYPVRSSVLPSVRSSRPPPIFHTQLCHTHTHTHTVFHTQLCQHHLPHTTFVTPSFTHNFCHTIFHTQLCHTPSFTQLCHTPSFPHNFVVTHRLSHTTLSHTHTPSFTHNFVSRTDLSHRTLSHTVFHTQLCHTHVFHTQNYHTHTVFHTQICHTPSLRHFVWQAWHLVTSTFVCGRCGAYGTGLVWFLVTWSHITYPQHLYIQHFNTHTQYVLTPQPLHTLLSHTTLHTILWHTHFPTQCLDTTLVTPPVPHHSFTHSTFTHDSFTHTHIHSTFTHHTFTHSYFTNNTFTRNSFTHLTSTCISCTYQSSTIYFLFPAFPVPFSPFFGYLLEEIDMWGLSGPFITVTTFKYTAF